MTKRLYLRTGEIPALYGLDASKSEWALWNTLCEGEDSGAGDYGKWQSRLMTQIMTGICEDHGLSVQNSVDPHSTKCSAILPPRSWAIAPSMKSNGRSALLVVSQRTEASLREWKEPGTLPRKSLLRYKAIAAAHDVSEILIGLLVDGYSSRLYHVHTTEEEKEEIRNKAEAFIESVKNDEEPDIDFGTDEAAIRSGKIVAKAEMSAENISALIDERSALIAEQAPIDAHIKRIEARIRQIDTNLIHVAGKDGRVEAGKKIVVVERDKKGTPRVSVIDTAPTSLF